MRISGHMRRCRSLASSAQNILAGREEGRPLAHVAWVAIAAFGYLALQAAELGGFILPSIALFAALCVIAVFDARYFIIPDGPLWFLIASAAATIVFSDSMQAGSHLVAAAIAYFAMSFVSFGYQKLRGTPGLGMGDAKLFAVAGLWLGPQGLASCLFFAVLSALASAGVALREGSLENLRQPLPFGPHLALGLWLVWALGPLETG